MFEVALVLLAAGVLGLTGERLREIGFRSVELGPVAARDREALVRALAEGAPETAIGALAIASREPKEGDDGDIAIEVALRVHRRRIERGLRPLRALAACASGLGFVGAIVSIGSIHLDHGLLDLDPERIARQAFGEAALRLALGLGTSAFALSSLVALQQRARVLSRELERLADRLQRGDGTTEGRS